MLSYTLQKIDHTNLPRPLDHSEFPNRLPSPQKCLSGINLASKRPDVADFVITPLIVVMVFAVAFIPLGELDVI